MAVKPYCILDDRVWVKADSLPAKTSKYFDVYKQGSESSSGADTFIFYEQWDDLLAWTTSGDVSISSGIMTCQDNNTGTSAYAYTSEIYNTGHAFLAKIRADFGTHSNFGFRDLASTEAALVSSYSGGSDGDAYLFTENDNVYGYSSTITPDYGWHEYKIEVLSASVRCSVDGEISTTSVTNVPDGDMGVRFAATRKESGYTPKIECEYVAITKCAEAEPVVITRDMGSFYRVYVYNDNDDVLTDFQFAIPASDLGVTAEESLEIYESPSDAALAYWPEGVSSGDRCFVKVPLLKANATHQFVLVKEDGYTPSIDDTMLTGVDWKNEVEIDSSKVSASGTSVTLSDGAVHLSGTSVVYSVDTFAINGGYIFCTKAKADEQDIKFITCHVDDNNSFEVGNSDIVYPDDFDMLQIVYTNGGSQTISYDDDCESFVYTWAKYEIATHTSGSMDYKKLGTGTYSDTITHANVPTSGNAKLGYRVWNSSQESTLDVEFGYVRKYASTEPTVSVEDKGDYYLITVTENSGSDLTDYQIYFDATDIDLSSVTESLEITEVAYYPSNYWIEAVDGRTFFVVPEFQPFETQTWAVYKEEGYEPNGDDVFGGFVDWRECTATPSGWVASDTVTYDEKLVLTSTSGTRSEIETTTTFQVNSIIESLISTSSSSEANSHINEMTTGDWSDRIEMWTNATTGNVTVRYYLDGSPDASSGTSVSTGATLTNQNIFKTIWASNVVSHYVNNSLIDSESTYVPDSDMYLRFYEGNVSGQYTYVYYTFIRQYAAVEPTVVVTNMGTWWKVTITNNVGETLTNYQVAIDSADLSIGSTDESLMIVQMNHGVSNQPYKDLFDGCVTYYDCIGDMNDVIGTNNCTVYNATLTTDSHGVTDAAYDFDGSGDYATTGTRVLNTTGTMTIEAIFKLDSIAAYQAIVSEIAATNAIGEYLVRIEATTGKIMFVHRYQAAIYSHFTVTDNGLSTDVWYHVFCVYDGSEYHIYVDGIEQDSTTSGGNYSTTGTAVLNIGCAENSTVYPLNGQIALIRLWSADITEHIPLLTRLSKHGYIYPIMNDTVGGLLE